MAVVPINPLVQAKYRNVLLVPDAPGFIDSQQPIVPVSVVNHESGPAIVTNFEIGTLKSQSTNQSVSATGAKTTNYTVPSGKRWLLKSIDSHRSSGSFTVDDNIVSVVISSVQVNLNATTGDNNLHSVPHMLVLGAGDVVKLYSNVTAYTSAGNIVHAVLYMEFDE